MNPSTSDDAGNAEVDDGGAAFAHAGFYLEKAGLLSEPQPGMTLRDYFAAYAPAMLSDTDHVPVPFRMPQHGFTGEKFEAWRGWGDYLDDDQIKPEWIADFILHRERREAAERDRRVLEIRADAARQAEWSYIYADAMLAARKAVAEPAPCRVCGGSPDDPMHGSKHHGSEVNFQHEYEGRPNA